MRKILSFAGLMTVLSSAQGADPKWIRMPSGDFEIYSSAGEGDTRRVLQYFERVHSFFDQGTGGPSQKREPVRVIVFGSAKEYEQYRLNAIAIAYYTHIAERDYIVLGSVNDNAFPIAVHEYVHLVAQNVGLKLPPWLSEGMAEVYSTLRTTGEKVIVGTPILARMQALSREKWVPLSIILAADHDSAYYNEKSKAGSLYNEGWALAHMLELSPSYSPSFRQFLGELQKGTPSQKALEGVYAKPLEAIEKDLQVYLHGNSFMAKIFTVKLQSGEKVAPEPASMFDVKLALFDLANRPGKEAEARDRLKELMSENEKRPEPHVALAYIAARDGQRAEAVKAFEEALTLGSKDPQVLWDYGRMVGESNPPQAMVALRTLLADQPDRMEARLVLAQIQMNGKLAKDAIETLRPVKAVTPKDAPRFFQILAFANLEVGDTQAARASVQRWIENSQDPDEKTEANRVLHYLDAKEADAARPQVSSAPPPAPPRLSDDNDDVTHTQLTRAEAPPSAPPQSMPVKPALPSISGTLVALDCQGSRPKFVLQTERGRVSFILKDPTKMLIFGLPEGTIDMSCGPQKPTAVRIQYDPPSVRSPGVMGIARELHFEADGEKR
jgi:tetratricopeptide (TPR) repeat protein